MAQTPEGKVKDWLIRSIKKEFPTAWVYKAPGGRFGKAGTPDLLCCIMGIFVAIEVKTDIGKLTKLQTYEIEKLELADSITMVLYGQNSEKLDKLFSTIYAKAHHLQRARGLNQD